MTNSPSSTDDQDEDVVTKNMEGSLIIERKTAEYPTFDDSKTYTRSEEEETARSEQRSISSGSDSDDEGTLRGSLTEII